MNTVNLPVGAALRKNGLFPGTHKLPTCQTLWIKNLQPIPIFVCEIHQSTMFKAFYCPTSDVFLDPSSPSSSCHTFYKSTCYTQKSTCANVFSFHLILTNTTRFSHFIFLLSSPRSYSNVFSSWLTSWEDVVFIVLNFKKCFFGLLSFLTWHLQNICSMHFDTLMMRDKLCYLACLLQL